MDQITHEVRLARWKEVILSWSAGLPAGCHKQHFCLDPLTDYLTFKHNVEIYIAWWTNFGSFSDLFRFLHK